MNFVNDHRETNNLVRIELTLVSLGLLGFYVITFCFFSEKCALSLDVSFLVKNLITFLYEKN